MQDPRMKVASEVWVALALLHSENPDREDFSEEEIRVRAREEFWGKALRPGFNQHVSYHCLANKLPNPANHRMLFETGRGRRRLFRWNDPSHSDRTNGKIRPERFEVLPTYLPLVDWYDNVFSKQSSLPSAHLTGPAVTIPHKFPIGKEAANPEFMMGEMRSATAFVGPGGTVVLPEYLQQELGLKEGSCLSIYRDKERVVLLPITDEFIRSLRGSLKGDYSLLEDREREHRIEKQK